MEYVHHWNVSRRKKVICIYSACIRTSSYKTALEDNRPQPKVDSCWAWSIQGESVTIINNNITNFITVKATVVGQTMKKIFWENLFEQFVSFQLSVFGLQRPIPTPIHISEPWNLRY